MNRDMTFVLENGYNVSVDSKKINIDIFPNINMNGYYINPLDIINLNIRRIIEKIFKSKIQSEHLGQRKITGKEIHVGRISKVFKLSELTDDYIMMNENMILTSDLSKWLTVQCF